MIKRVKIIIRYVNFFIIFLILAYPVNLFAESHIKIYVSILPQKYFVEKIGKGKVEVDVLIKPGKSPATYAPSPSQIKKLGMSDIYFQINLPFENTVLHKIKSLSKTQIVDSNKNIVLRDMGKHHHNGKHHHTGKDPHSWMNPLIVKTQANTIFQALTKFDPENKDQYKKNYLEFIKELNMLDKRLRIILKDVKGENIFVFHPFLGYFTDAYDLKQIAIETMGKAPKGKELSKIIKLAKKQNIKTIFVQPQFDQNAANKIADVIHGKVVSVNPLAYDYLANMENIAQTIAKELKNR